MLERIYHFKNSNEKLIEKIVDDDNLLLNHVVLGKGEGLPEHFSNSNVYLIIAGGTISIKLGEQEEQKYSAGSILNIPYNIKMNISNRADQKLEFFIVKAPNPKHFGGK